VEAGQSISAHLALALTDGESVGGAAKDRRALRIIA